MSRKADTSQPLRGLFILIPVLNEAASLQPLLTSLQVWRDSGALVIVADGGSDDGSAGIASAYADHVLDSAKGRAKQMNTAADYVLNHYSKKIKIVPDAVLFLHADTYLPNDFPSQYQQFLQADNGWGFFPVKLDASDVIYRIIGCMISWRSRLSCVATGDQVFMIKPCLWHQQKGFSNLDLMEDLDWSYRCKKSGYKPWLGQSKVLTSARRWQQYGVIRTVVLMWCLRFGFYCGLSAKRLASWYR